MALPLRIQKCLESEFCQENEMIVVPTGGAVKGHLFRTIPRQQYPQTVMKQLDSASEDSTLWIYERHPKT